MRTSEPIRGITILIKFSAEKSARNLLSACVDWRIIEVNYNQGARLPLI